MSSLQSPSFNDSLQSSSLSDLADGFIQKLDRTRIFPPFLNEPEDLVNHSKRNARPPRPPNGFLLCRKNVHEEAKRRGICNMRVISKVTGMLWRAATPDEKEEYEKLAMKVHNLHSQRYPGYKYRPASKDKPSEYRPYVFSSSLSSSSTEDTTTTTSSFETDQQAYSNTFTHNLYEFTNEQLDFMTAYLGMSSIIGTTSTSPYFNDPENPENPEHPEHPEHPKHTSSKDY